MGEGNRPCLPVPGQRALGIALRGERATAAPRDGNWPGHEWERCSIHKCRVLLQPWRRLCWESPARGSCSSLCQQIPLNSLLTLVWVPLTKLSKSPAVNHGPAHGNGIAGQEMTATSPVSAPCEFVQLKRTELVKAVWIFLSSHKPDRESELPVLIAQ